MGSKSMPAFLVLLGFWISTPPVRANLPPELSMAQMTHMFQDFMRQFNKTYQSQEEMLYRFKVFLQNLESSRELQALELGTAQYGVTQFSDLTESEFVKKFGMAHQSLPHLPHTLRSSDKMSKEKTSTSCDWRKAGAVTAVKDQGEDCRSCWAFSAVSNIEALWNIHKRMPQNISVQEMIDCTYNRRGCKGGYAWDGFEAVFNRSGLSNSKLYPYFGKDQRCQSHHRKTIAQIDGYSVLPRDEQYIASIVASQGPVTALINTTLLQSYKGGIIRNAKACGKKDLDHVVTIVGFGQVRPRRGPYWIIQNSWGEHWGEKGYFRLDRGSNACGIAMYVATAVVRSSERAKPLICPP